TSPTPVTCHPGATVTGGGGRGNRKTASVAPPNQMLPTPYRLLSFPWTRAARTSVHVGNSCSAPTGPPSGFMTSAIVRRMGDWCMSQYRFPSDACNKDDTGNSPTLLGQPLSQGGRATLWSTATVPVVVIRN